MYQDLTKGKIGKTLILFALPMMAGNFLQQFYNIADTLIVGRVLGRNALAAVGSAYTLMTFLTSIFLGFSMGAGALFSIYYGKGDKKSLSEAITQGFLLNMGVTIVVNVMVYVLLEKLLVWLQIPAEVMDGMRQYLLIIFAGLIASSVYNFFACMLRALGNSLVPLVFLGVSTVLNVGLDILFVIGLKAGISGAAYATIFSQYLSAIGICIYVAIACKDLRPKRDEFRWNKQMVGELLNLSTMTCIQQSVMNLGILMVQGLVNSFGAVTMAAFAAAVKIDTVAYLPVEDFGNAYATFIAQNFGAGAQERIKKGTKQAFAISILFAAIMSLVVCIFAQPLMQIFVGASETHVIATGVQYLRIEGACYVGIACLFLLYGYYRAVKKAFMSVVLTVISLGTRVVLAYLLAPGIGEIGIWMAIPIGWALADMTGLLYARKGVQTRS